MMSDEKCCVVSIPYRAVGSISANIAEGYSKASKKDEVRYFEYALGSARESRDWYYKSRHILGEEVFIHRARLLVQIIKPLLKLVPEFRGKKITEEQAEYEAYALETIPFSELPNGTREVDEHTSKQVASKHVSK